LHHLPLERDEGAYAVLASGLAAGQVPYRDLFDHKPPLVFLVYMLALPIPGDPVVALRLLATGYLLASGAALLALGWRLYGRWAGLAALALTLAYGSSLRFQGITFNSEAILLLPALLACLALVEALKRQRPALAGLAGLGVGLATLAKPVGGLLLLPLALALLAAPWFWRTRLRALTLALAGGALPLLLVAGWLWTQGALPAAYEALVVYNRLYAAESLAMGWDFWGLASIWGPMLMLAGPGMLGLLATLARRELRQVPNLAAAGWGLALLGSALLSLRAYPHYYLVAVPFFALWAGAGLVLLSRLSARWLVLPASLVLLLVLLAPPLREIGALRGHTPTEQSTALYGADGLNFFAQADEVAAYVQQRVPPNQPIFVWAAEPQIYYLAQRPPATRFVYDYPLERLAGARDETLAALRREPPALIITYRDVRPIGSGPLFEELGYRLQARIGGFDMFGR
jgi:4-amino-4-deoxy-L-arabinose transferase-like glycosyltransferase